MTVELLSLEPSDIHWTLNDIFAGDSYRFYCQAESKSSFTDENNKEIILPFLLALKDSVQSLKSPRVVVQNCQFVKNRQTSIHGTNSVQTLNS